MTGSGLCSVRLLLHYEEQVALHLMIREEGSGTPYKRYPLARIGSGLSECTVDLPWETSWSYYFTVVEEGELRRSEPVGAHTLRAPEATHLTVRAAWEEGGASWLLRQAPLCRALHLPDQMRYAPLSPSSEGITLLIRPSFVLYQCLSEGSSLLISGESDELGGWEPTRAVEMQPCREGWFAPLGGVDGVAYKLVLRQSNGTIVWEEGANRRFSLGAADGPCVVTVASPLFAPLQGRRLPSIYGAALPLFSLRTETSFGCGDFGDAELFVTKLAEHGMRIFQTLPIYDTTWHRDERDSYPYRAITTYGLHPMFLRVQQLPFYDRARKRGQWEAEAKRLNALSHVAYREVLALKEEVIRYAFERWWRSKGHEETAFRLFVEREREQLLPYVLFCVVRDARADRTAPLPPYEEVLALWEAGRLSRKRATYYAFVQYHLYEQLAALVRVGRAAGVLLKGDLPIGVARESVDSWCCPELFHLDRSAGAPPDAFSKEGQNWLFPTYNWQEMQRDGYAWWRQRLRHMGRYFDLLRIDHVLGFFRIWTIPVGAKSACLGYFDPALTLSPEELPSPEPCADLNLEDTNVLLVRGLPKRGAPPEEAGLHPRIGLMDTGRFAALEPQEQACWARLHDDFFYARNEELWRRTAQERLSALVAGSEMLLCAEDLGMLPESVGEVLRLLQMLSLEVVRMPKKQGRRFVGPSDVPEMSVLTTGTHDVPSLRGWWRSLSEQERADLLSLYGRDSLGNELDLVRALAQQRALLIVLPLADWCVLTGYGAEVEPAQEQINDPGNPNQIWDYRMPGTVESLVLPLPEDSSADADVSGAVPEG